MCSRLTEKAEPQPTRDVNRDSGTASANGGWLRRLVRHQVNHHQYIPRFQSREINAKMPVKIHPANGIQICLTSRRAKARAKANSPIKPLTKKPKCHETETRLEGKNHSDKIGQLRQ